MVEHMAAKVELLWVKVGWFIFGLDMNSVPVRLRNMLYRFKP